ncbi:MAG TPA: PhzF family phenazine biosynthesis protein [Vicinamibacterales bacterium]|jgi:trans-2,3-dihydro-3-hydroxyanthranilate isomerase|nr:PhzF family phenazine biosynthesis protein [Vicinamibacterales bacterium]
MNRREWGRTTLTGLAGLLFPRKARAQSAGSGRAHRYVHLDVFTDRRLAGNQLLVFPQPAGLDAETMQGLTRESNYSECTFVFPPEQAGTDHRVRIFGRTAEMPFAGHPTIGTAFALAHVGVLKPGMTKTTFGLGVGPTNIDLEWKGSQLAFAWMTQLKPTFGKTIDDTNALAAAIGLEPGAVVKPAQEVHTGSTFLVVPLATRKAVDTAVQDRAKMDAVFAAAGVQRRGMYIFSTERAQDDATAYSRLLGTGGIEDPATGSAAGPAGSFAVKHGFVPADRATSIVFLQGVLVRRPSRIHVRVDASAGEITGAKVGGTSVVVGEGTMTV